ncbi:MAG TPA: hypothetical protein VMR99_00580 [Candidatus Paceibacterota bacterium]|nr:hypothetical protein [Candidatus Paceibacterota bacterium]
MNKKYITTILSAAAAVTIVAGVALPAFAETSVGVGLSASATFSASGTRAGLSAGALLATRITALTGRADQEITRRLSALGALTARVDAMIRLSGTDKSNLATSIQSQITAMNTLQAQISADAAANNTSSLKTDVQSITSSYRIFALILPQGMIEAAADRVLTIVGIMNDLATKFSARISTAQSAGNNVTAATAALTDFNAKVSDANTQAQAAVSEVVSLMPDNGSSTVMASNTATLKDARSKILAAQQDFVTARADAETIIKALATFKVSANASTTASTTSQ